MNLTQFPQDVQNFYEGKSPEETLDIQMKMATRFVEQLKMLGSEMDEITPLSLLDTLGVCGMSLTIGDVASNTFFREMKKV